VTSDFKISIGQTGPVSQFSICLETFLCLVFQDCDVQQKTFMTLSGSCKIQVMETKVARVQILSECDVGDPLKIDDHYPC